MTEPKKKSLEEIAKDNVIKDNLNNWCSIEEFGEALDLAHRYELHDFARAIARLYIPELKEEGDYKQAFEVAVEYVPEEEESCAKLFFVHSKAVNDFTTALHLARTYFPTQEIPVKDMYINHLFKEPVDHAFSKLVHFVKTEYTDRFDKIYNKVFNILHERKDFIPLYEIACEHDDHTTMQNYYPHYLASGLVRYEELLLDSAKQEQEGKKKRFASDAKAMLSDIVEVAQYYLEDERSIFMLPDSNDFEKRYESSIDDIRNRAQAIYDELEACNNNPQLYVLKKDFDDAMQKEEYLRASRIQDDMLPLL